MTNYTLSKLTLWLAVLSLGTGLQAATIYWDGGTVDIAGNGNSASGGGAGTWNATLKNWDDGAVPHEAWGSRLDTDTAVFASTTGNYAVTVSSVTASNISFSTATYTLSSGTITLAGTGNITATIKTIINSVIDGTAGLTKAGTGALTLGGANTYTGTTTLSTGTLNLSNASALGTSTLTITGGTLDSGVANLVNANNNEQKWNGNFIFAGTNNLDLGTGAVALGATRQVTVTANTLTVGGIISGVGGITKAGAGTLQLTGANSYTGTTTVNVGTLTLSGSPTGNSAMTVNGGTLQLDYSTNNTSKISDTAVLTLGTGGTVSLSGGTHTEIVASTTLNPGTVLVTGTAAGSVLQLGTITRNGGPSINFSVAGLATTNNTNDTNGILGPWATVGGTEWAVNSTNGTNGSITAYTGYTNVAFAGAISTGAMTNIKLTGGTSGNVTLGTGTTTVNTIVQAQTTATTIDAASKTLRLGTAGGILLPSGKGALTIGTAGGSGRFVAGAGVVAGGATVLPDVPVMEPPPVRTARSAASRIRGSNGSTATLLRPEPFR